MLTYIEMIFSITTILLFGSLPVFPQKQAKQFQHGAVAADATPCSTIGAGVLRSNGSAVDAWIASVICLGVYHPMSSGLGGGGVALVYSKEKQQFFSYDFFGVAPEAVYKANLEERFKDEPRSSMYGALAPLVPGQLKGLWEMWKDHGRLPWRDLIQPTIDLANKGIQFNEAIRSSLHFVSYKLKRMKLDNDFLSFVTNDKSGEIYQIGDMMDTSKIVETLKAIQDTNTISFYHGEMATKMAEELRSKGGILTKEDFSSFEVKKKRVVLQTKMKNNMTLQTVGLPFDGTFLANVVSIMSAFNFNGFDLNTTSLDDTVQFYHVFLEAFKFALGNRAYQFDPDFSSDPSWPKRFTDYMTNKTIAEDIARNWIQINMTHPAQYYGDNKDNDKEGGTSHVSVLADNGDAVSGTNTINFYFGSMVRSSSTGIIFNNGMNDFSNLLNLYGVPPSKWNKIAPHKTPRSSIAPAIVTRDNGDVAMVIGASGGPRIPMAIAQVAWKNLFIGTELGRSIDEYRIYNTALSSNKMYGYAQRPIPEELIERLQHIGHLYKTGKNGRAVVQAIHRLENGTIYAASDTRKLAEADGY